MVDPTTFIIVVIFIGWSAFVAGAVLAKRLCDYQIRNLKRVCVEQYDELKLHRSGNGWQIQYDDSEV